MAKHDVSFSLPERSLGRADVKFQVKRDGKVHGTLAIFNGSVVWFPKGTSYGLKVGWTKFEDMMKKSAKPVECR